MAEIESLVFRLLAETKESSQRIRKFENDVQRLERQVQRSSGSISSSLRGVAGTLGTYFTGRELVGLIDSFTRFQNQLRVAGLEGDKLADVQERLRTIGSTYGVELEALGSTFNRASLAQKELGASTEQIIRLNEIVAAGLKVAGTSSQQASGALLQLAQALGSGVVRAEEFNSILEGALPVAQAAARGIDGMGGSVAKLRSEIASGNVTSRQFFEGVLKGGTETIEQAERATLTLSGAFTALRNELTLYFGNAAKTTGATTALAEAIKALADNLDRIIPALAVIATVMTGRFLAGAIGGGRAMQALAAHVSIATHSLAGLRLAAGSAGTALVGALGGVPGIAISAALAIGYVILQADNASESLKRLRAETETLESQTEDMERRLRDAGVELEGLGDGADTASDQLNSFWGVIGKTISRLQALARQAGLTRAALIGTQIEELRTQQAQIERERLTVQRQGLAGTGMAGGASPIDPVPGGPNARGTVDQRRQAELQKQIDLLERQQKAVLAAGAAGIDLEPAVPPAAVEEKKKKAAKGRRGPSEEELERRRARAAAQVASEIEQLEVDRLRIIAELTNSAEDRARAEEEALRADRNAFDRQIALDEDLTKAQRDDLAAARDAADAQRARAIEIERLEGLAREQFERESSDNAWQQELASARGRVNDRTAAQRRATDLRLIDLEFSQREAEATRDYEDAVRRGDQVAGRIAQARLARIAELKSLAQQEAFLANQSPMEALRDQLSMSAEEMNEALESVQVRGLRTLEDGIVGAMMQAESLGDVFSNVADQIIADLIRIAVQQAIIKPLADLLGGGSMGGGGLGGLVGSIFGGFRANGGPVSPGRAYVVGERGPEVIVPKAAGVVIPNQMLQSAPRQTIIQQTVQVDARGVNPQGFAEHIKSAVRQETMQIVAKSSELTLRQVPTRMQAFQRNGT